MLYALLNSCITTSQDTAAKNNEMTLQYELVKDWLQLPAGFILGNPTGIDIDREQNVVVFYRATRTWSLPWPMPTSLIKENTIMVLDPKTGKIIKSWGANMFIMPHGLIVDKQDNIWVTDCGLHQVFKFNHEGALLMKLGEAKKGGNDNGHFNRPTDVAVAGDGSFYVSDGYINSRVVKFSAEGKYLFEWGKKGEAPGEFNIPHSITLDGKGHVYVADRQNNRVQVFDSTGKFLKEWKDKSYGNMYAITYNEQGENLLAVDYITNYITPKGSDVMLFDTTGRILNRFGRTGLYNGPVCRYHDIAGDNDGNIYVCDILKNTIQKFKRVSK